MWLRGFGDAIFSTPTQAQWDIIKKKMDEVGEPISLPSGPITRDKGTWPNTKPWENPFKITCEGKCDTKGIVTNGNTTWTNIPKDANVSYTIDK